MRAMHDMNVHVGMHVLVGTHHVVDGMCVGGCLERWSPIWECHRNGFLPPCMALAFIHFFSLRPLHGMLCSVARVFVLPCSAACLLARCEVSSSTSNGLI
jgi:hypothetical protein